MFRFLHSSDLHLGKRFGNLPEDLRGRLREARHAVLGKLAGRARDAGAEVILLAGDTFDTETPSPEIRRQALAEMAHHTDIKWVLMPGNHDSLQAAQLWDRISAEAPPNLVLATNAGPLLIAPGVAILPAPCTTRRPGRDLSEWMDGAATPEGTMRIGLAHGPILSFSEDTAAKEVLAPDRAARAGLDYLALGDWHGPLAVNDRTFYSGTPEPDRFKHDLPGQALLVTIAAPGAVPEVAPQQTATFAWQQIPLHILASDDPAALLASALPPGTSRRQTLLQMTATGRMTIAGRTALEAQIAHAAPEFALFDTDFGGLETEFDGTDLDAIDRAGALREAAETLMAESLDETLPADSRAVAQAALRRLFSYAQRVAS